MRKSLFVLPLLAWASPTLAQAAAPAGPAEPEIIRIPPELTDPATAQRLTGMVQALSNAFLDMPVGGVKAAAEGRQATPAEKRMTVRDLARKDDPDFDRNFRRQIATVGPVMQQSMKAFATALPEMMQGLHQVQKAIDRAAANMPDPNYPRR